MSETFALRYVAHDLVAAYAALGWIELPPRGHMGHHEVWSRLMKWDRDGEPREPVREEGAQ